MVARFARIIHMFLFLKRMTILFTYQNYLELDFVEVNEIPNYIETIIDVYNFYMCTLHDGRELFAQFTLFDDNIIGCLRSIYCLF